MSIPTILPSGRLHPDLVNNAAFVKYVDSGTTAQSGQISADALKEGSERLSRDFRKGWMDIVDLDSFFTRRSGAMAWNEAAANGSASANACDAVTISAQAKESMARQERR